MYKIFADDTLIYDSTIEDYKIGKGNITLESNKSGSFVFSLSVDHPYYDRFVKLKTIITIYKSGKIVFRGRVLHTVTDYWNNKTLTCEGELGFLQDSITRPFSFDGTPAELFAQLITNHNDQVDEFKRFKIGDITVEDDNDYINRTASGYGSTLNTLTSATVGSALGGYIYITHGDDGTDPIPTIHYLADFPHTSEQTIEFGVNLKDYTKTVSAEDMATAIIPLGSENGSGGVRLTIADINNGVDYIYSELGVATYGWVFKTVVWDDVTIAQNLKTKAERYLNHVVTQTLTIELNAIDLHLLDRSIESFRVCDYVRVRSKPHNFDATLLCSKQTMDLLKPENDTVTLGYQTTTLTDNTAYMANSVTSLDNKVSSIKQDAESIKLSVEDLSTGIGQSLTIGADGVTITNMNGERVIIDGGQINAKTLNVEDIKLSGVISFEDLSDGADWMDTINGKPSASRVKTLITDELVSSPRIAGGVFENLDGTTWLNVGQDMFGVDNDAYGLAIYNNNSMVFGVYNGDGGYTSLTAKDGYTFLTISAEESSDIQISMPFGTWDFSNAEVIGLAAESTVVFA